MVCMYAHQVLHAYLRLIQNTKKSPGTSQDSGGILRAPDWIRTSRRQQPDVLRHTHITMAAAHLDVKTLQTIAGHADISTTMNRYAHGREDRIIQANTLLAGMYGGN